MIILWKTSLAMVGIAALLGPSIAEAAEWSRATRNGGAISRSVTRDGAFYSGQTTRVGPNGGVYTSSSTCHDGVVDRCGRSYSSVGPNGRTISGASWTARGPYGARSVGVHTGPRGNDWIGYHRFWR